ncbi:MAG: kinase [Pseudomonadota bacterium]
MIITRTPFRISFFDGGTDYPAYYNEHGGAVLNTTINKYCYLTVRYLPPFFDHKFRIRYTKREETNTPDEIVHPSVKACLQFLNVEQGVEIVRTADIPAMSGIGSSSSFTVGLLHALYALQGKMVTKRQLAFDAIHVERDLIKENVGSQDQMTAAFGGLNRIEFSGRYSSFVQPITLPPQKLAYLQSCMLFYFTGFSRYSSDITQAHLDSMKNNIQTLKLMSQMVDEGVKILNGPVEHYDRFGLLLHEAWRCKRGLSSRISNRGIDEIYEKAVKAGALGGKICVVGGGGFLVLFAPPERHPDIKEKLKKLLIVPINFEQLGSHVVFYSNTTEGSESWDQTVTLSSNHLPIATRDAFGESTRIQSNVSW